MLSVIHILQSSYVSALGSIMLLGEEKAGLDPITLNPPCRPYTEATTNATSRRQP